MSDLDDDTRALLRAAAHGDDPSTDDRARVRAKIAATLAAGAGATAAAATAKAATVATKLTLATKLTIAVVVAAAAVTTYSVTRPAPTISQPAPADAPTPPPSNLAPPSLAPPALAPPSLAPPSLAPPSLAPPSLAPPPVAPAAPAAPRRPASTLAAETTDLSAIRTALTSGDAARALTLLDRFDRAHPRAHLAQEAAVARIDALCALHRDDDAGHAVDAFLTKYPDSPHTKKVTHACSR